MKKLLVIFFLTSSVFGMPCPNGNGGPLYKGDSIDEVIKQCGQPVKQNNVTRTLSTLKKLVYYKPMPFNAGTAQIIILFRDDKVVNININEETYFILCRRSFVQVGPLMTVQTSCGNWNYYTTYTTLCGVSFATGYSLDAVLQICGPPNQAIDLETKQLSVTELVYGHGQDQTIVFENNKLVEWR